MLDMFGVDLHIGVVVGRIEYDKYVFVILFYLDYVLGVKYSWRPGYASRIHWTIRVTA